MIYMHNKRKTKISTTKSERTKELIVNYASQIPMTKKIIKISSNNLKIYSHKIMVTYHIKRKKTGKV